MKQVNWENSDLLVYISTYIKYWTPSLEVQYF